MANASSVIEQTKEYFDKVREGYKEDFATAFEGGLPNMDAVIALGARFAALNDVWRKLIAAAAGDEIDAQYPKETE